MMRPTSIFIGCLLLPVTFAFAASADPTNQCKRFSRWDGAIRNSATNEQMSNDAFADFVSGNFHLVHMDGTQENNHLNNVRCEGTTITFDIQATNNNGSCTFSWDKDYNVKGGCRNDHNNTIWIGKLTPR